MIDEGVRSRRRMGEHRCELILSDYLSMDWSYSPCRATDRGAPRAQDSRCVFWLPLMVKRSRERSEVCLAELLLGVPIVTSPRRKRRSRSRSWVSPFSEGIHFLPPA
jgi:hypothetical protein